MLRIENLVLRFPGFETRYALTAAPGTLTALIGPSGGGKTTLLNAIAGFEQPSGGALTLDGADLLGAPAGQRPVALLFQEHNLFPDLTAYENAALGASPNLRLTSDQASSVTEALHQVDLAAHAGKRPAQLSGGQRQRAAIARMLLMRRPVFLLDEPFGALDPGLRLDMIRLIRDLTTRQKLITLLSLHTPQDAEHHAESLAFIDAGEVQWQGSYAAAMTPGAHAGLDRYFGRR